MNKLRVHFVAISAAASVAAAGSAVYMLLSGEQGALRFVAWAIPLLGVSYAAILVAMRTSHDRCSEWLRHLAAVHR